MGIIVFYEGKCRSIYANNTNGSFLDWCQNNEKQHLLVPVVRIIHLVADIPYKDLFDCEKMFKPLKGTYPKLYTISRKELIVFCSLYKRGILLCDWEKDDKLDIEKLINRAEYRARRFQP